MATLIFLKFLEPIFPTNGKIMATTHELLGKNYEQNFLEAKYIFEQHPDFDTAYIAEKQSLLPLEDWKAEISEKKDLQEFNRLKEKLWPKSCEPMIDKDRQFKRQEDKV